MKNYYVAWWNLENLFDSVRSDQRPDWLQKKLKSELEGWTTTVRDKKIGQLAKVINDMNGGRGPDVLGVCEVENDIVLQRLVDELHSTRHYGIAHHDMSDQRGIDVAFIYDEDLFTLEKQFSHVVLKRNATRDLFQVNLKTASENTLILIGNHWPSRSGGQEKSEPYRQMAGEALSYWVERIKAIQGEDQPVIVMGDLNDEPFNSSVMEYALGERDKKRVVSKRTTKPYLLNLMWESTGAGQGTHFYNEWGMLDHVLINAPLLKSQAKIKYVTDSVEIIKKPEMINKGKPRRFSRPSAKGGIDEAGFSDHLPVKIELTEKD